MYMYCCVYIVSDCALNICKDWFGAFKYLLTTTIIIIIVLKSWNWFEDKKLKQTNKKQKTNKQTPKHFNN